ncbi:hypothetical protein SAMN05216276_102918 [Streptosporangium subroseum]|uniref:Uncharacterized protein n=1 Tax=Streptosporangium subroseum TaxID=106412 RepID=A0A239KUP6_9ACTN|nr:hypothetical protein [Streptosporangium subroseum]SNT22076.1 hypothetical protein SAMN05216276_102918 [Streptosporangium subroseum]
MAAEFELGDYILVQDGNILEVFHRTLSSVRRFHVAFLGVYAKPRRNGFKVMIGPRSDDRIINGVTLDMNPEELERFQEFMAPLIAARDRRASL